MILNCSHIAVLLLTLLAIDSPHHLANAVKAPSAVVINKCCRIGEQLDRYQQCVVGSTEKWWPVIYLILKNQYFQPFGDAPRFLKTRENSRPTCSNSEIHTGSSHALFSNGSLYLSERHMLLNQENYCIDKDMAIVCLPEVSNLESRAAPKKLSKVKKCCGAHAVYSAENSRCMSVEDGSEMTKRLVSNSSAVDIVYGLPKCQDENAFTVAGVFHESNLDYATGSLTLDSGQQFSWHEYCLEHTIDNANSRYVSVITCMENFSIIETAVAVAPKADIRFFLYSIGLLISVIFLAATLATGFLLPSNHHVLHWRCQTFYVACLLVGDLLLAITQISGNAITGFTCISIAVCMHFFFLAAFFWLNTMCFNIWWTFRDFRPTSLEKGQEIVRLRIYKVYAWGLPLIIASTAIYLDNVPKQPGDLVLRPNFGASKCWFQEDKIEILVYFYGPIGILLFVNLMLFASTARQLTCGLWKRDEVKSTTERTALGRICMKLVVVMGVTWVIDVISWAVGGPDYLWIVTDLINALQGVFIFIVVGCQPQVTNAMKRIWSSKTSRFSSNTTNGHHNSSSSQSPPSMGESTTNNTFTNTTTSKIPMETIC